MKETMFLLLGLIAGLQISCLMIVGLFFFYGHKTKKHVRRYLNDWERREREKRGLR